MACGCSRPHTHFVIFNYALLVNVGTSSFDVNTKDARADFAVANPAFVTAGAITESNTT